MSIYEYLLLLLWIEDHKISYSLTNANFRILREVYQLHSGDPHSLDIKSLNSQKCEILYAKGC